MKPEWDRIITVITVIAVIVAVAVVAVVASLIKHDPIIVTNSLDSGNSRILLYNELVWNKTLAADNKSIEIWWKSTAINNDTPPLTIFMYEASYYSLIDYNPHSIKASVVLNQYGCGLIKEMVRDGYRII